MQSPSSLIFLVLLGVWAAYFVQYWVRRRDHVATARSVDQFSTAMRVLERRDALPHTDLSEPAPRSYAVHPARAARPQVMVKRAVAAEPPAPGTVTERIDRVEPVRPAPVAAPAARRAAAPRPAPQVRPGRRVRGLLFLVALAELVVIVPLVSLSLLPVWALAPATVALGAALAFVRSGARTEDALARAHRRRAADLERLRSTVPVVTRTAQRPSTVRRTEQPAAEVPAPAAPVEAEVVTVASEVIAPADVVYDVSAAVAELAPQEVVQAPVAQAPGPDVMVPIEVDDDIPLTWDPVPVPRPTYTMKAKAYHPEVPPAAVTPDPAPVVRESVDETYEQRRVAGA
ncbi:hypothetical protein [Oryzobacter telluris]|uniref:hypothetical protein n=1 Tax=Oryzobacter telluris TaxID=3149179 RepID=UPI00370D675E